MRYTSFFIVITGRQGAHLVVNIMSVGRWLTWGATLCTSGCVVECWTCNRKVTGLNLGWGYFAPRSTQPSIPLGSVNEYQLRLGRQRQVWIILLADEIQGVQVKLWYPLTMHAIPERCFMYRRYTNQHYLYLYACIQKLDFHDKVFQKLQMSIKILKLKGLHSWDII